MGCLLYSRSRNFAERLVCPSHLMSGPFKGIKDSLVVFASAGDDEGLLQILRNPSRPKRRT